jgi:hypothetical protein
VRRRPAGVLLAVAGLAACGKRGDPLPPFPRTPQVVSGLALTQRGDQLELRMSAPRTTTSGQRLPVLEVEVLRAEADGPFEKTAHADRRRAAPGESLVESVPLPPPGTTVRVAARARDGRHVSALSPVVTFVVKTPPPPPTRLEATLVPQGVSLSWQPPVLPSPSPTPAPSPTASPAPSPTASPAPSPAPSPSAVPPPGAAKSSVTVAAAPGPGPTPSPAPSPALTLYRREPRGEAQPLITLPPTATTQLDVGVAPGQRWCYTIRTVMTGAPVESAPTEEACVDVKDIFPPAAPIGVAVLVQEGAMEVSWSPSPEMDLASYRVYRSSAGARTERLGEAPAGTTVLKDPAPPADVKLLYTVTAVDKAGNESPPSAPAEARR